MSSPEPDPPRSAVPPSLEELSTRAATAFLLPWILRMAAATDSAARDVVVFVHQPTRSITLMEGSLESDPLVSGLGPLPASKASIESLPLVRVSDPGLECPICLNGYEDNEEVSAKEMPCGHGFHSGCIEKWLRIHGSCPVCRFVMPVDEEKESDERGGWRVHVFFARGRAGSESDMDIDMESGQGQDSNSGADGNDGLPGQDMEIDN